ncbi:MAG: efflux RND transporter permease subunit [Bryobacteraceae bacterium]|nr:efflux RND transporter permease subunit [Bryobacteraceae bacterium]
MNFTTFFIERPVATTLLMAGILVFGILGYRTLPVSDLPPIEYPTISVGASVPGASPETMAATVATPLERQFSTIAGIDNMSSSSSLGRTSVTLQFDLDRNIDAAAQDVMAAISRAQRSLPVSMPSPPSYNKVNPADQPVLYMALTSASLKPSEVSEYADTTLAQRFSMVSGVAQVEVYGLQKYAIRVQTDPDRLASAGIGIEEVRQAISSGNVLMPSGALYGDKKSYTVQANTQLTDAAGFRPLIVAYRQGAPIRLEQVANVVDSVQNDKSVFWRNEDNAVVLAVRKQPGTNTVEVVDGIQELMPVLQSQLPAGLDLEIHFDRSQTIRESIADVQFTMLITIALVILVIFVFIRNASATIIPSLAVPLSLIGTFGAMYLLKYNVDNLTLMAMTLSVGFVVDDAIVMLENIVRHMEMGKPKLQAAIDGAKEVGFTILSMTMSLVAVFIPVLFLGGIVGRLLKEFSVTIAVAVLISGLISLTLTPMLCSRWLKREEDVKHGRLYLLSERAFQALLHFYERTLLFVLRHKFATFTINLGLVALTAYLFVLIPKDFLPPEDIGSIMGSTEAAEDTSFTEMAGLQRSVRDTVRKNPYVHSVMSGVGGFGGQNTGFMFLRLKEAEERPPADVILNQLRGQLAAIPGINTFLRIPPLITIGTQGRAAYLVSMLDADTNLLYEWAPKVEAEMQALPALVDVVSDLRLANPRLNVDVDRDRAMALGVTPDSVAQALFSAFGNRQISTINTATNEYYVILEVAPELQKDPSALDRLYVRANTGKLVPLSAVTVARTGVAPLNVNHNGQMPSVNITFNLKQGAALGDAVDQINAAVDRMGMPPSTKLMFQGTAQAFQESTRNLPVLLIVAVAVIYLLLGMLYESFIHPVTILSGLPSAGLGAVATLMLFKMEFSLYGFVGLLLLIGIVKKNAIMMIDFALNAQRVEGRNAEAAIVEGCLRRFRPILMTTMAAMLGALPIAVGFGASGAARRPLGLSIMGGLIVSQAVTLYLTPVLFLYFERFQQMLARRRAH